MAGLKLMFDTFSALKVILNRNLIINCPSQVINTDTLRWLTGSLSAYIVTHCTFRQSFIIGERDQLGVLIVVSADGSIHQ